MRLIVGVALSTGLLLGLPQFARAEQAGSLPTGSTPAGSSGYFMPPADDVAQSASSGSAVIESHPAGLASPVIDSNLVDTLPPPSTGSYYAPTPWYETDWGVAGIGIAATGASMAFDHGVNQFANTKLSDDTKNKIIKADNILETLTAVFPFVTMVQSPISDPELAHASSIAATSVAEVTVVTMGLKYVIGRVRPNGSSSNIDPFVFHPFDAAESTFSLGAVLPFGGAQTSSFPSGHTALAFAVVTPYAELYHEPILYAIPVAVGIGRVLVPDGHWVSDVVGGGFVGWLTADITRRWFPNSDYGLMIFGIGKNMQVGFHGQF